MFFVNRAIMSSRLALLVLMVLWGMKCGAQATATRYYPPSKWILGPLYGTGAPCFSPPVYGSSMADEVNGILDGLGANDIPVTGFLFDGGGWAIGNYCGLIPVGAGWALGQDIPNRLSAANMKALLHFWGGLSNVLADQQIYGELGSVLGGIYLDEGATDALAKTTIDFMQSIEPGVGEVVMKSYQSDGLETDAGLQSYGHTAYVNDLPTDFSGLQEGIQRVFAKSTLLPAPYNEFTGYGSPAPDEETMFRRIHFGALQPVMAHEPRASADPWSAQYSPGLLADYRYYAWLHRELIPYFYSYDYNAYQTGQPIFRNTDSVNFTTNLGDELFVAYVTSPGVTALNINLPAGQWINYWNESQVFSGPVTINYPVPLGQEPIFIQAGAIIPMQVARTYTGHGTAASAGSLTVLVYPSGSSSFHYRDDGGYWVTFASALAGGALTLTQSQVTTLPVLYRIEQWLSPPVSVGINSLTVTVNQGGNVPPVATEDQVNGASSNAWFYDSVAHRLVVKFFPSAAVTIAPPTLSISSSHTGDFTQGQQNGIYLLAVSNAANAGATAGQVTVTDTLPSGLTLLSMSGEGWTCSLSTCTRSDALFGGGSYPPITVMVSVASNATSPLVNQASVSGGGSTSAMTNDPTVVQAVTSQTCPCTIWSSNATPNIIDIGPDLPVELGVAFKADVPGVISGLRFYKSPANLGPHVGNLWSEMGMLLASATFTNETLFGWQEVDFSSPIPIVAGVPYVASYHSDFGDWSVDRNYFALGGYDNPPLHALSNGGSTSDGLFLYGGASGFPTQTYESSNYWVDVVFRAATPPILAISSTHTGAFTQGQQNAVYSLIVSNASTGGASSGPVIVTETLSAGLTLVSMSGPGWTCSANACTRSDVLASGSSYPPIAVMVNVAADAVSPQLNQVNVTGGGSPTANVTDSTVVCPCTIWSNGTVPAVVDIGPDNPVELGVVFTADVPGVITGVRFFKSAANVGTHIGNLWSDTGALLATAPFVNESDSGWQQVNFSTPVPIAAGTSYVASYHSDVGDFSVTWNYFAAKGYDNPPLHALQNGATGGNGLYLYSAISGFPTQTYASSNYWIDVVFSPSP